MVKPKEKFRPYAAASNIIAVLQRARSRNVPEAISNDFLRIAGIPEVVLGRVMQALRFLNLIYEDGRPTDTLMALAAATDENYRELLAGAVREAYRAEFEVIDPGEDPQHRIVDAFRPYEPRSQTARMVMLFLGLCREAGIPVLDVPRERRMKESQLRRPKPSAERYGVPTKRRLVQTDEPITIARRTSGVLFGVTEDDVAALDEAEFNEVWTALGKVARARARAKKQLREEEQKAIEEEKEESAEKELPF